MESQKVQDAAELLRQMELECTLESHPFVDIVDGTLPGLITFLGDLFGDDEEFEIKAGGMS